MKVHATDDDAAAVFCLRPRLTHRDRVQHGLQPAVVVRRPPRHARSRVGVVRRARQSRRGTGAQL